MAVITAEVRSELLALTIGMFKAAPGANYLNQMVAAWGAGASVTAIADSLAKTPQFALVYPPLESAQDFATRLIANLLDSEVTDSAAKTWAAEWVVGRLNAGITRAEVILTAVQAIRATAVSAYANAKLALANKIEVAEYYSVGRLQSDTDLADLQAVVAGVTSSAATVTAAKTNLDNGGFEILELGADASGAYSAVGFTSLKHGVVAGDVEFTAVAAGTGLAITATPTRNTTYTLADSSGAHDSLALTLVGEAVITTGTVTASGVENIAITSDDTNSALANLNHELILAGDIVKTITVAGDAGLILTAASTALTSFDAGGTTNINASVTLITGALAAVAILTGGAGGDTLIATAATKAVILNGGEGNDTLTVNNANDNTVNGSTGDDMIVVGTGSNKIFAGAGNDTVTVGASAGLTTIDVGAGTDIVVLNAPPFAAGFYTSVTGMNAGDKLDFSAVTAITSIATSLGAKVTLGGAAGFSNYLNAATASDADSAALIKWFQLGGNTYVVIDNGTGADTSTFEDGVDSVIELVGLVDLSASTVAGDVLTVV